ncbi:hypothetical protein PPTG_21230 [Phytophthora nicotianae INRA-310]|uniref:Transcription activator GCR1-like domain-containing protein n=1 Tax=Phytophthora nicotianae (strain INRA-310) TaxID=761204 RepID=W2R3V8_PHYN3|nr:hypothetical protein PPTG_21230 [Phytophthora nicotianae INRA-310]ETN20112.1 hypothetical protein PPTG_21230 [Phytophthora nicotianae INRA-310]
MSRGISTVKELWAEGHDGVADKPSIEYLETTYAPTVSHAGGNSSTLSIA